MDDRGWVTNTPSSVVRPCSPPFEQVMIPGTAKPVGLWRAVVIGSTVPLGPQDYSLVFFW